MSHLDNRCHLCGEVSNLVNLVDETRHVLVSVLYIKCSCYHMKVHAEENNSHFYILFEPVLNFEVFS